jgi:glutaredoxin
MIQIAVIVKGENRYFSHWLAYHREHGFGPVTVFLDEDVDYCKEADRVIPVMDASPERQVNCCNAFLEDHKNDEGYVMFIDIDEYVDFTCAEAEKRMKENKLDALMIPQVPYIAADDKYRWKYADIPVTERFTARSCCGRLQPGKMIMRFNLGVPLRTMQHVYLQGGPGNHHEIPPPPLYN